MRFSTYHKLKYTQSELDFVDVPINKDLRLFIDPFSFSKRRDIWSVTCHNEVISFFKAAIDYIRSGNLRNAKHILSNLSEPNETHLGLSSGRPRGRGVSGKQALDLYEKLVQSKAVKTGLLSELSDCELLIDGIGPDKISDITTNIIRNHLIKYTQEQCKLHNIALSHGIPSGRLWNDYDNEWVEEYTDLPVIKSKKIILVPKAIVRWSTALNPSEYYNKYVLTYLQAENIDQNTSLVRTLVSGEKRVYKKDLKEIHPFGKELLFSFTKEHPEILAEYKKKKGIPDSIENKELEDDFDESVFAEVLIERLRSIPSGSDDATKYHHFMIGVLEFIFYPNFIYPKKEREIDEGRKRIDICYINNAIEGFFRRFTITQGKPSVEIMVECKNYSSDPHNPELDQLSGRFSNTRGCFGLLMARHISNKDLFIKRCRDTANAGRGFIIPLDDDDVISMLDLIGSGKRNEVDLYLTEIYRKVID